MSDPKPRKIFLNNGRVIIECPLLMLDDELATALEAFVQKVRARPRREPPPVSQSDPSSGTAQQPPKRWR
jgi:hypothetical protein